MNVDRVKKKYEELKKKREERKRDFWEPKEGINEIRILPNCDLDSEGDFYYDTEYHKSLGPDKKKSCVCLIAEGYEKCPVCDLIKELYKTKDKEDAAFAKEIKRQPRIYWNIVDLKAKEKGVQTMSTGNGVFEDVLGYCANPKYGDLTDPKTGRNITLIFTPSAKSKTTYNEYVVQPDPEQTPLEEPKWLEQMADLKEVYVKVLKPEEIEALIMGEKTEDKKSESKPAKKPEAEKKVEEVTKSCLGKYSGEDQDCLTCAIKEKCLELRKSKIVETPKAETPKAETPKAETPKVAETAPVVDSESKINDIIASIKKKKEAEKKGEQTG
ncbi:hypothetical protein A2Z67_03910 [Candidatus Woesebacteria bacterium RBG_13_36_22]|uniref:Uncharacterized protein n=1 Tax=Candidatus Woesebacteria bacterium RBG_13_36_22 TaxID=1802478 RepID=A0A1F7WZ83_9BACT|nr:MAG: hypothetical protein A2Z67_03910 [Candidatus Woesebacteria bacterium RBG_13_36_22]